MVTAVDATLAHSRLSRDQLAHQVQLACVLEVSAPKPGNITPARDFADTTYAEMVRSALALGPVFTRRRARARGRRRRADLRRRPGDRASHGCQHESRHRAAVRAAGPGRGDSAGGR